MSSFIWGIFRFFKWMFLKKPRCGCGGVLVVNTRECLTSNPCRHGATCPECEKGYTVYGLGDHTAFTLDYDTALGW